MMSEHSPDHVHGQVEPDRRTRPNNLARKHRYPLGAIVEVSLALAHQGIEEDIEINLRGTCRLYVVGHMRDGGSSLPLYVVSDLPVQYPLNRAMFDLGRLMYRYMAHVVEYGYGEDVIKPTGKERVLYASINAWLQAQG
jgi:hypothetical protein